MYPDALDAEKVGSYPARAGAGGGLVWDAVLEYRVWMHPEHGAPDISEGGDYYHAFATYDEAASFAQANPGAEEPLALVLQLEHLNEPSPGVYEHVTAPRQVEWPPKFLVRPKRTPTTIPNFLAADAPPNRLDILRGIA
ncbi:hypothetical protein [Botrimarina mediterranea]|nr:hypothetical protein [Botrimarina mediterranea]QDV79688.1 hypothetical protein K2D_33030 [Planctomycetes bacterium K2D]